MGRLSCSQPNAEEEVYVSYRHYRRKFCYPCSFWHSFFLLLLPHQHKSDQIYRPKRDLWREKNFSRIKMVLYRNGPCYNSRCLRERFRASMAERNSKKHNEFIFLCAVMVIIAILFTRLIEEYLLFGAFLLLFINLGRYKWSVEADPVFTAGNSSDSPSP